MIGGSSTGNAGDTRTQRNPATASPFGDFKTMQPSEAPQPGQPYMGVGVQPMPMQPTVFAQPATPPMAPVDSVMTAGQRELMEARQIADQRRAQEAADAAMGNALGAMPYGQPSRIEMPYGISKPMHGMAVPMHTHGENGEIQMGGVQGHTEGRPYRGPMPDLQTVASTLDFMK